MNNLETTFLRFKEERPIFVECASIVSSELQKICQSLGMLARIEVRAKEISSFVKKVMTDEKYQTDPWKTITDKVGARVIVDTRADKQRMLEGLQASSLSVFDIEDKAVGKDPHLLYYSGIHMQSIVPGAKTSDDQPIECEIQLKTKAEDLWSARSHELLYKCTVKAPDHTQRRVWRLSALTEIFDEEVDRAMNEILTTPGYDQGRLLTIAESFYYTLVPILGVADLSLEVLLEFEAALPHGEELILYEERVKVFVATNRDRIEKIYEQYGASSEFATNSKYWMFTQPESVLILESISTKPMLAQDAARSSAFAYAFEPLFTAWGTPFST